MSEVGTRPWYRLVGGLLVFLALAALHVCGGACTSIPRIPAAGQVAGHPFSTTVDSTLARDFLAGVDLPDELEAARIDLTAAPHRPSSEQLAEWSRRFSPDVATLLFVEALTAEPTNRMAKAVFEAERAAAAVSTDDSLRGWRVLFVPGWLYRTHGHETGADWKLERGVLSRMSVTNQLAPLDENGTVEENARTLAELLCRLDDGGGPLLIVSASKSSPEVALALGEYLAPHQLRHVAAWLSVGGVLRGSPLADRALQADLCWLIQLQFGMEGFGLAGLRSLRTEPRARALEALHLPAHVVTIQYVGAPLSGDVGERARMGYGLLRSRGPNDGLTLLCDQLLDDSVVLIAPGVDHFFQEPEAEMRTVALLRTLVALAEQRGLGSS